MTPCVWVFHVRVEVHIMNNGEYISAMRTSSNGNIFRITGLLWWEFTGHRWIPLTKASDAELWGFLWSAPWIDGWINNRETGDLRRHRAHYDVNVMVLIQIWSNLANDTRYVFMDIIPGALAKDNHTPFPVFLRQFVDAYMRISYEHGHQYDSGNNSLQWRHNGRDRWRLTSPASPLFAQQLV